MSIVRCDKHQRNFDTDYLEQCPLCLQDEIDALIPKAESGEQWAHICYLESLIVAAAPTAT